MVVLLSEAAAREDAVPAVVDVSFTTNTSDVSKLLVNELVSNGAVVTVVAAAVVIIADGVTCVVIISVVSLARLLVVTSDVAVDIGAVLVLVTMVTGCMEAELVCIDDNFDDGPSTER